ncbi:hypothetical protein [uncultured Tateyamaria sp.]|uniref:bestrophin-like domain n=1 Tax=uncultured Tateyamaria sp. TaxID=455651 RepID=UPI002605D427|nr:hypothetical protein [uncultured Tateyamaria sp.]
MGQTELMYDIPSYLVSGGLFLLMIAAMWLGIVTGKRLQRNENDESKSQANAVQGSLLGLLALLLGFTFSLSLGRYDERASQVVNEANAIGTAWLRTDLVAEPAQSEVKDLFRLYAQLRLTASTVPSIEADTRDRLIAQAEGMFDQIWEIAAEETQRAPSPVTMGFAASLNDMIDALATRDAAIDRHVPELVLFLLFGTFILLGAVIGFASAISNVRPGVPVYAMMTLIVILVFLIIDLDRPRRGLIEVDQTKLITTVQQIRE